MARRKVYRAMPRYLLLEDADMLRNLVNEAYDDLPPKDKRIVQNYITRAIQKFADAFGQL